MRLLSFRSNQKWKFIFFNFQVFEIQKLFFSRPGNWWRIYGIPRNMTTKNPENSWTICRGIFFLSDCFKLWNSKQEFAGLRRPCTQTSNSSVETDVFGHPRRTFLHELVLDELLVPGSLPRKYGKLQDEVVYWTVPTNREHRLWSIGGATHIRGGEMVVQSNRRTLINNFSATKQIHTVFVVKIYYFMKERNRVRN